MRDFLENVKTNESDLEFLQKLTNRLIVLRAEIDLKEDDLKKLKLVEQKLSGEEIPTFLQSKGIDLLKLKSGQTIEIKEDIKCTLPKDPVKRLISLDFITKNGGEGAIKEELKIESPEQTIIDLLKANHVPFNYDKSINAMTLKAFVRDLLGLKKGGIQKINLEEIPKELNVYIYKQTKIK